MKPENSESALQIAKMVHILTGQPSVLDYQASPAGPQPRRDSQHDRGSPLGKCRDRAFVMLP